MKLLFAIKGMDRATGGAERVLAQVTAGLIERDHEVALASFDSPGGQSFYPLHERLRRIPLGIGHTDRAATLVETLSRIPALRRTVCAERPDIAIGFMHSMFVPLAVALLRTGVPLVASEHTVADLYAGRRLQFLLLTLACLRADRVTVLSASALRRYPRFLHRRMIAVANPITDSGGRQADPKGSSSATKTLLAVGRLHENKNHSLLICAYRQLADDFPDWRLRIVGEGVLRAELDQTVRTLDLEGQVELVGATRAIDREYLGAHLVVVPSRYEGFGLVTGEALSFGLPVIGFADCPGTNELIVDGVNGILVAPGDRVANLAAALRSLMADSGKRAALGAHGPESVLRFGQEAVVDRWEQMLGEIAGLPLQGGKSGRGA